MAHLASWDSNCEDCGPVKNMLEQRNWRVLLILFILFNERTSTNGVQRTLQSDYSPPQFLAARKNSTLQGHAHSLKMKTEREHYKNPSINQANHEGPLSILKIINVIHRRHVFVASIERSSRIQRDLRTTHCTKKRLCTRSNV